MPGLLSLYLIPRASRIVWVHVVLSLIWILRTCRLAGYPRVVTEVLEMAGNGGLNGTISIITRRFPKTDEESDTTPITNQDSHHHTHDACYDARPTGMALYITCQPVLGHDVQETQEQLSYRLTNLS